MKAIFLSYAGTILQQRGDEFSEVADSFIQSSDLKDADAFIKWWVNHLNESKKDAYGEHYKNEEAIATDVLNRAIQEIHLTGDLQQIQVLMKNYFMYGSIYNDVRTLFNQCSLPIYIICDNGEDYVRVCMRRNGLHPYGVISADSVHAYRQRKDVFEKALQVADVSREDVLYIGESPDTDIKGAQECGIPVVLLDRRGEFEDVDCKVVHSLTEVLRMVKKYGND